jgi:hypothetical protein
MATMNITAGGPWVQSVTLQYEQASTADIGVINFVDAPGADGTVTKTIARGTTGGFNIKVVPMNGFTGQVVLAVGPITKVGGGEDVSGKIIASNMPQTLTIPSGATEVPATVQFTVNDDATLSGLYQFTVSGHDTSNPNATLAPADWGRINVPAVTGETIALTLTIPVEGGKPTDTTLPHPRFTLRLYNSAAKVYEKTDIATDAQDQAVITATRIEIPNGTYTAYARSTRHLWAKATVPATLVIDVAHSTYGITFPTLKAGNLDANNRINSLDLPPWMNDYGKTIAGLLGDLNNDDKVNVLDVAFIFGLDHYGAWGDQMPDETR